MPSNKELLDSIQKTAEALRPYLEKNKSTDQELVEIDDQLNEILDSY